MNTKSTTAATLFLLSVLIVAVISMTTNIAIATPATTTTTTPLTEGEQAVQDTQDISVAELTEEHRDVNGIEFTPRWGAVASVNPQEIQVLFADCMQDEFAVSSSFVSESPDLQTSQSFPLALPDNKMTWLAVVTNTGAAEVKAVGLGVICAGENIAGSTGEDNIDLDVSTRSVVDETVRPLIHLDSNYQITNLQQIINVRQQIIQNAINIVNITGNNNTVNQVINQSASQIIASNGTNINQIVNQTIVDATTTGGGANTTDTEPTGGNETVTTGTTTESTTNTTVAETTGEGAAATGGAPEATTGTQGESISEENLPGPETPPEETVTDGRVVTPEEPAEEPTTDEEGGTPNEESTENTDNNDVTADASPDDETESAESTSTSTDDDDDDDDESAV